MAIFSPSLVPSEVSIHLKCFYFASGQTIRLLSSAWSINGPLSLSLQSLRQTFFLPVTFINFNRFNPFWGLRTCGWMLCPASASRLWSGNSSQKLSNPRWFVQDSGSTADMFVSANKRPPVPEQVGPDSSRRTRRLHNELKLTGIHISALSTGFQHSAWWVCSLQSFSGKMLHRGATLVQSAATKVFFLLPPDSTFFMDHSFSQFGTSLCFQGYTFLPQPTHDPSQRSPKICSRASGTLLHTSISFTAMLSSNSLGKNAVCTMSQDVELHLLSFFVPHEMASVC